MRDPRIDDIRAELGIDENRSWGTLADILRALPSLCDRAGVNIAHVTRDPEYAVTSISLGLATLGKLLADIETAKELSPLDVTCLGDLIATTAELIAPLQDIACACASERAKP
ncbi:hypothetical protein [Halochromatium roseum]|uniref:hypothetical protein n=1 Tax=Halochromatium roseum TaxID=391920 RepID=UPI0019145CEB|nr:hypothetical protein [Halochromatium roseum]MBK5938119.1 hypothetical protein [Halochromatium roseum]